jgi:LEA14-like dessication related protein
VIEYNFDLKMNVRCDYCKNKISTSASLQVNSRDNLDDNLDYVAYNLKHDCDEFMTGWKRNISHGEEKHICPTCVNIKDVLE